MKIAKIGTIVSLLLAFPAAAISITIASPWTEDFNFVAMLAHPGLWLFYLRSVLAFSLFGIVTSITIQKLTS